MALLPSVATRMTVEASRYRSAVSEFLIQTLGKSINYLLDKADETDADIASLVSSINSQYGFSSATAYAGSGTTTITAGADEYIVVMGFGNFPNDASNYYVTTVVAPSGSVTYYRPTANSNGISIKFKKLAVSV